MKKILMKKIKYRTLQKQRIVEYKKFLLQANLHNLYNSYNLLNSYDEVIFEAYEKYFNKCFFYV